jgi:hypothetical protein
MHTRTLHRFTELISVSCNRNEYGDIRHKQTDLPPPKESSWYGHFISSNMYICAPTLSDAGCYFPWVNDRYLKNKKTLSSAFLVIFYLIIRSGACHSHGLILTQLYMRFNFLNFIAARVSLVTVIFSKHSIPRRYPHQTSFTTEVIYELMGLHAARKLYYFWL